MTAVAVYWLLCAAGGFTAGWIACWVAGLFETARQLEPDASEPLGLDWDYPLRERPYDWQADSDEAA